MMKSSEEMVENLLERRTEYEVRRKKQRKRAVGLSVSGGCCALILCAAFLLPGMRGNLHSAALPMPTGVPADSRHAETPDVPMRDSGAILPENPEPVTDGGEGTGATLPDETAIPEIEHGGTASPPDLTPKTDTAGSESFDICYLWWRNSLSVTGALYHAIEDDPAGTFTVLAVYRPTTGDITDFTYEGKTLSEWAAASVEARLLPEKMAELLKMGDALKYGEDLYETGTPEGEKWDRRLYEDKIAYYGEALLRRYIVDGEFLREKLENDLYDVKDTVLMQAEEDYRRAFDAYLDETMPVLVRELTAAGLSCQRAAERNDALILTATAEELENLPLENGKDWYFDLLR